jgi:hypothetical protein
MDSLEEYIKRNREAFDDQELPEGHFERFEARLGSGQTVRVWFWTAIAGVAAAVAAVVIFTGRQPSASIDWFAEVPEDQASICQAYYEKMAGLYQDILASDVDGSKEAQLAAIAEETIPLIDQLPEELGAEERAAILKEYYSDLLGGIERIAEIR